MDKRYTVQFRRKREGRTNYKKRLELLKSGKLRLVVRPSLKNVVAQLVEYHKDGDKVVASAHSKELQELGWKANRGNIPAAYLTGYLLAKKTKKKQAVLDIGNNTPIKGSRIFAVLKGAVDGGMKIPHDAKVFPSEERIQGKHIADYADNVYQDNDFDASKITDHFQQIKKKIEEKK